MFYTSYFAKVESLPQDMVLISISLWSPKWWRGWKMKSLAPTEDILRTYKRDGDIVRYTKRFENEVLGIKDCAKMVTDLKSKFGEKDICFLCYEGTEKFCHRHLVAKWLNEHGYACREW